MCSFCFFSPFPDLRQSSLVALTSSTSSPCFCRVSQLGMGAGIAPARLQGLPFGINLDCCVNMWTFQRPVFGPAWLGCAPLEVVCRSAVLFCLLCGITYSQRQPEGISAQTAQIFVFCLDGAVD